MKKEEVKTETTPEVKPVGLALLRVPFEKHQISKLPKPTKAQTDEVKADFQKGVRCQICNGWHHPKVVHLDYVGHAALTDRLLDADPSWNWEPMSLNADGTPKFDSNNGLWIKLTVCGVSRIGYGHPDGKNGGDAFKETIGDALRNAGMRFGAALDLWHKGDLHLPDEEKTDDKKDSDPKKTTSTTSKEIVTPAEYVVKVGKKFNGMKLKDILDQEIEGYIDYLVDGSKKTGKPLSGDWIEFVETAEKYLSTKTDPKLNNNEEIPF